MKRLVERSEYLNFLKRHQDKPLIKVVSGVRRAGKSTLFQLFRDYLTETGVSDEAIISINFEDMAYDSLRDARSLYDYLIKKIAVKKKVYIFLDEIQHVENFERVVDSLFIKENVDLYITGSNAYFLSGEIATLLSGRYVELKMLPLSFSEFVEWKKQNEDDQPNAQYFNEYLKSSMPYTLFTETDQEALEYLQGVYSTVVLNDIVARLNVSDVRVLERLIETLFSSVGSLVTVNKIKNTLVSKGTSISNKTVEKYLQGILDSLILYEAKRYDVHGRELLDTQSKYYVVDSGLRRLILRDHHQDFGHVLENIVYLELLRRGNKVYVGKVDRYEVDFVAINAKQEVSYYQVALTTLDEAVLKRELRSLQAIKDSYPKYLLTLDEYNKEANFNGIKKMNVLDWLLSVDS
ncbi:ATP-binding protein [Enterococcus hulanensis]|uniref:ATP-binding protein n=1 Tax=Enterococcus hulanensis TaxID=2559929 RepID=A0ABU3EUW1_9ENTE|nr:ATP-binding protein [Enterococcus hulanensis]MDT2598643.1 ATP-binding protein [Enterococcus hulanensis]MDT2607852.1 ATP-binding protein [Enterococcus hulanensis]MDT2615147.1 ATP-binding protein [Enterococcus hulanensis]MDT2626882.1 ATP-binding protein [Enterococcus hulanensis]MDT2654219.1 ATP-binding protein [Enterococcus hulanensis]